MLDWLADVWNTFVEYLYLIFESAVMFLKDFLFFVFDTLFQAIAFILNGLGSLFTALSPLEYISAIPSETQYYMQISGFTESMGMIVTALLIRMLLQLIPFVRLGS